MNQLTGIPLRALVLSAAVLCLESGFADELERLDISNEQEGKVGIHLKGGQGLHQLQRLSNLNGDWLNFGGLTSEPHWFIEPAGPFELFRAARAPEGDLQIWRKTDQKNVTLHLGRTVTAIDPANRQVLDAHGGRYSWDKLLLATGGSPRRLPFGDDHLIYFRTLADYRRLRALTEKGQRFAVIGGGFIGSEIAAALTMNQKKVVMLFPGKNIGDRIFPHDLAQFVSNWSVPRREPRRTP